METVQIARFELTTDAKASTWYPCEVNMLGLGFKADGLRIQTLVSVEHSQRIQSLEQGSTKYGRRYMQI